MNREISRRSFLQNSLAGAGVFMTAPALANEAAPAATIHAHDRVALGKTGIVASRLAMGTGMHGSRHESDHTRLGQQKFTELIRHGFDKGLNFFDMADLYGSQPFVKNALEGIPRDQYVLLTKIWFRGGEWYTSSGGAKEEVDRFRKELGVDTIDIVLIHCVTNPQWPDELKRVCDELSELKEKGAVRAVGASFHNFEALKVAAENPWGDVILARINHAGKSMDASPDDVSKILHKARDNGKCLLGMKIFGEGKLIEPDQKAASMKYVWGNKLVDAMTIGMLSVQEVDDSIMYIEKTFSA